MDNEASFDQQTKNEISKKGILVQATAPYTPEQNGAAERSGQTLVITARCLRIESQFPTNLWPMLILTAAYLANRTPLRRHSFKTPDEILHGIAPRLHHLKIIGCKAYVRQPDQAIRRTRKLDPRAQIGYLVGYSASTIYSIWISSLDKVIRSRDVTFDENSFYDPRNPLPDKVLREFAELKAPELDVSHEAIMLAEYADTMDIDLYDKPAEAARSRGGSEATSQNNANVTLPALEAGQTGSYDQRQVDAPRSPLPQAPRL